MRFVNKNFFKIANFFKLRARGEDRGAHLGINEAAGDERADGVNDQQRGAERDRDGDRGAPAAGELPRSAVDQIKQRQRQEIDERMVIPRAGEVELHEAKERAAHPAAGAGQAGQPVYRAAGQKKPQRKKRRRTDMDQQHFYHPSALCRFFVHTVIIPRCASAVNSKKRVLRLTGEKRGAIICSFVRGVGAAAAPAEIVPFEPVGSHHRRKTRRRAYGGVPAGAPFFISPVPPRENSRRKTK